MSAIFDDIRAQFRYGNVINQLIIINVAVFVLLNVVLLFNQLFFLNTSFYHWLSDKFAFPSSLSVLLYQPWSLISYMFMHAGVWHLAFNMLSLMWFGRILVLFLGEHRILSLYIMGGIAGAVLYMLLYNSVPLFASGNGGMMVGASAAVMAIAMAAATLRPDYPIQLVFLGEVRIKYLMLFFVLLDIVGIAQLNNAGGSIAHLGGVLYGFLYIKRLQQGDDWSVAFNNYFERLRGLFQSKPKSASPQKPYISYRRWDKSKDTAPQQSPTNSTEQQANNSKTFLQRINGGRNDDNKIPAGTSSMSPQQRIDAILDKISESGYDSLNAGEKDFLQQYSKDH